MRKKEGVSKIKETIELEDWINNIVICDFDDNMDEFSAK